MFVSEIDREYRAKLFLNNAIKKHGDKFDYTKVQYINNYIEVIIICKKHGAFTKRPSKHLAHKHSCPECAKVGYSNSVRINKNEFIVKATKAHGNLYSYDKTIIQKRDDKIDIYCTKHKHYFIQRLNIHLDGRTGCKFCLRDKKEKLNHDKFKEMFIDFFTNKFGTYYDFSNVAYINNRTPVIVKCLKHNYEFKQVHRNAVRYKTCSCKYCKNEQATK